MLTDALVDGLAEVLTDALAETLIETETVDCASLPSEFLFGNTYTGKQRSRPRPLCDKN